MSSKFSDFKLSTLTKAAKYAVNITKLPKSPPYSSCDCYNSETMGKPRVCRFRLGCSLTMMYWMLSCYTDDNIDSPCTIRRQ